MANKYVVIDTQINQMNATLIEQLNGRQGDGGRVVYFSIRDGNSPYDISNKTISIIAKDAQGKVKVISTVNNIISAVGGLFSMVIPSALYQASGNIEEAYLKVYDDSNVVITSVPITFTVLANNVILTSNASSDYIDSVQEAVNQANKLISGISDNVKAQSIAYDALKSSLALMTNQINSQQVALKNGDNSFSGTNLFNNTATFSVPINGATQSRYALDYFSDINKVVTNMKTYVGNYFVGSVPVTNGPNGNILYAVIEVIAGNASTTGIIRVLSQFGGVQYTGLVDGGVLKKWVANADDSNTVHKTGNETVAGNKNNTGIQTFTQPIVGSVASRWTSIKDVNLLTSSMTTNSGIWYGSTTTVANMPKDGYFFMEVQPVPGSEVEGFIRVTYIGASGLYIGKVSSGKLTWVQLYSNENTDKTFISGNYGLRVTTTGIQKTSDGGSNWTNI